MTGRAEARRRSLDLLTDDRACKAVSVVGPPGIGKSHLLDDLATELGGHRVDVIGFEEEAALAWAGLEQLVRGLRDALTELPPAQKAVLEHLLTGARSPGGEVATEAISVAAAAHALVCAAARQRAVTIVVDDAHWLDADSSHALRFIARRLLGEPVRVLVATRQADVAPTADVVHLEMLEPSEATAVLRSRGLVPHVAERVARLVGGTPLLLVNVADRLTPDQRIGAVSLPDPLPISTGDLPGALADRVRALPPATRDALHLVAFGHPLGTDWSRVLRDCGADPAELGAAEAAGMAVLTPRAVDFAHPLHRAAALADATPMQRRAAHQRLADAVDDPDRALVHRARALLGPDDAIAAALDELAERLWASGAVSGAAERWQQAAETWADDAAAARSRIRAAGSALRAGNIAPARQLLDGLIVDDTTPLDLVELAAAYHLAFGDGDTGHSLLVRAAERHAVDDPRRAAELLFEAVRHRVRLGDLGGVAATYAALVDVVVPDDVPSTAKLAALAAMIRNPHDTSDLLLETSERLWSGDGSTTSDLAFVADVIALPLAFNRRYGEAMSLVARLRTAAAASNQPAVAPLLDTAVACALSRYDLPGCVAVASSAVEWADELDQPNLATTALRYLVTGQALLGDEAVFDAADRLSQQGRFGWITSAMGKGTYWLTVGRPERCLEVLLPLHEWLGGELKAINFWQADLGEAAVRTGDRDLARVVADELERFSGLQPNPWLVGAHARVEGMLADIDSCDRWFQRSVDAFRGSRVTVAEARSQLLWGERLRRARRRAEARPHLEIAHDLFTRIGASIWASRCDEELAAAGAVAPSVEVGAGAERVLTAHELRIARLAAAGGSYKSIAAELFLSPRTIETHLSSVYRKLNVRNRAELAAVAVHDPALRPGDASLG